MTIKEKYYDHTLNGQSVNLSEEIAFAILHDMKDRRGFRQAWDSVDEDIQCEILNEWVKLAEEKLNNKGIHL